MKRIIITSLVFAFAIGAFGHFPSARAADVKPVSAALAPMPKPALPLGTVTTWRDHRGFEFSQTIVASDEATITLERNRSCTQTISRHAHFIGGARQSLKWTNCGRKQNQSGTASIKMIEGEIWPLKVGRKWRTEYKGSNNAGRSFSYKTDCEAKEQVRVSVPAGSFDTYHIFCETSVTKMDMYISPVLKTNVLYKWEHKTKLRDYSRELISYTSGKAK